MWGGGGGTAPHLRPCPDDQLPELVIKHLPVRASQPPTPASHQQQHQQQQPHAATPMQLQQQHLTPPTKFLWLSHQEPHPEDLPLPSWKLRTSHSEAGPSLRCSLPLPLSACMASSPGLAMQHSLSMQSEQLEALLCRFKQRQAWQERQEQQLEEQQQQQRQERQQQQQQQQQRQQQQRQSPFLRRGPSQSWGPATLSRALHAASRCHTATALDPAAVAAGFRMGSASTGGDGGRRRPLPPPPRAASAEPPDGGRGASALPQRRAAGAPPGSAPAAFATRRKGPDVALQLKQVLEANDQLSAWSPRTPPVSARGTRTLSLQKDL